MEAARLYKTTGRGGDIVVFFSAKRAIWWNRTVLLSMAGKWSIVELNGWKVEHG